ncbi:UNVERIFIED_CONTAM: hypothetical protein FKN15_041774 [Acipenser sinensis]
MDLHHGVHDSAVVFLQHLAGHLIECGAQCTGGIFTDWYKVPDWDNIGFPIVECSSDGTFILSKPPKTGGLVSFGTVAEQLVYEIADPSHYLLPDVTCDFSKATITEVPDVEGGAVKVQGAKGSSPSSDYKNHCPLIVFTHTGAALKTRRIFKQLGLDDFTAVNVQILGSEDTYGPHAKNKDGGPREAVVWLAVRHSQKRALELFAREIAPAGTGMDLPSGPHKYRLEELAYTRSGDKGDTANIGVVARHPLYYPYLKKALTAQAVEEYFQHLIQKDDTGTPKVRRYELPGINGLNFVLRNSLGGGGVASLRSDPQFCDVLKMIIRDQRGVMLMAILGIIFILYLGLAPSTTLPTALILFTLWMAS